MSVAQASPLRRKPLIALDADHKRIIWLLRTMGAVPRIAIAHQLGDAQRCVDPPGA